MEAAYQFLKIINRDSLRSIRTINLHWCAYLPVYLRGSKARRYGIELNPDLDEQKWEVIWQILSSCTELQNLYVKIFDEGYVLFEDILLEPRRAIRVQTSTFQLPWPWGFQSWRKREPDENYRGVSGEGCSFQIIRPYGIDDMVVRYAQLIRQCTLRKPLLLLLL
jgi:hypothetical protein